MNKAQTILNQIKSGTDGYNKGIVLMMCWGFNKPTSTLNGLKFNVKGKKLIGKVEVNYNEGSDLYDLVFSNRVGRMMNTVTDVYAEDLTRIIDSVVESGK